MPFYRDHIYPHLVSVLGDPKPIQQVRQRVIPLAKGVVLEIGAGPGVNFVHYDPVRVSRVYALEPNPGMIRLAENSGVKRTLKLSSWTFLASASLWKTAPSIRLSVLSPCARSPASWTPFEVLDVS